MQVWSTDFFGPNYTHAGLLPRCQIRVPALGVPDFATDRWCSLFCQRKKNAWRSVQSAMAHTDASYDEEVLTCAQDVSCLAMGLRSIETVLELESIGTTAPSRLTRLCLHANSIGSLDGLHVLTSLRELLVSCNPLPTLGRSLSTLVNLRMIDATSCKLQDVDGLSCLSNLQHLVRNLRAHAAYLL